MIEGLLDIERKSFGAWSRLASWRFVQPYRRNLHLPIPFAKIKEKALY